MASTLPKEIRAGTAIGLTLAALLFATSVSLQVVRDRDFPAPPVRDEMLYIRSGAVMRRLTLSFNMIAADIYWIRALQEYGGTKLSPQADKRYPLLYPLLNITTSLDPRFDLAYRFGAIFLAESYPNGPGRPDEAIALLEKGLKVQPDKWQYMQDIGFVYYWWRHDYPKAAAWFSRASRVPGAPWFLRSLAANTLAAGGNRTASRLMWEQIYDTAGSEWLRKDAAWRLQQLNALDQIARLQAGADAFHGRHDAWPDGWMAMVRDRALPGIPVDPAGTPYDLNPATGRVTLSRRSSLWPLPTEPAPRGGPER
ncbi:MAG TPA: hypothetical protein VNE16_00115 [Vicinamibacterales bacterium]|nr:hypothetical protein [Vicinamibacterales bacterium]